MACSNTLSSQELIRLTFCNHPSHPTREFLRVVPTSEVRLEAARLDAALHQQQVEQASRDAAEQILAAVVEVNHAASQNQPISADPLIGGAIGISLVGMQAANLIGDIWDRIND